MATVRITDEATEELNALPVVIHARVDKVLVRLVKWPEISGAKALTANLKGNWRIRTGDYRVVFAVADDVVTVWKIGYRGTVYD